MDKVLVDIEKLKDADRDISYKNGTHNDRGCNRITYVCKRRD